MSIRNTLGGLSDVEGVIGSFVITDAGVLVGSNLPAVFDADLFADAGPRIIRLLEASAALSDGLRACVLRFSDHKLFVKQLDGALLGVLLTASGSLPALKIAANIVTRKVSAMLAQGPLEPQATAAAPITHRSPTQPSAPSAQPTSADPAASPPKRKMFFRGQPVG